MNFDWESEWMCSIRSRPILHKCFMSLTSNRAGGTKAIPWRLHRPGLNYILYSTSFYFFYVSHLPTFATIPPVVLSILYTGLITVPCTTVVYSVLFMSHMKNLGNQEIQAIIYLNLFCLCMLCSLCHPLIDQFLHVTSFSLALLTFSI